MLGIRYDTSDASVLTLVDLADEPVDIRPRALEELEQVGDVLSDRAYDRPQAGSGLRLGPHGYRWLRGRARHRA